MKNDEFEKKVNDLFDITEHKISIVYTKPTRLIGKNSVHKISFKTVGKANSRNVSIAKGIFMLTERIYEVHIHGKLMGNYYSCSGNRTFEKAEDMIFFLETFVNLAKKLSKKSIDMGFSISYIDPDLEKTMRDLQQKSSINKVKYIMAKELFLGKYNAKATMKIDNYVAGGPVGGPEKIRKKIESLTTIIGDEESDWELTSTIKAAMKRNHYYPESFTLYLNKENVDLIGIAIDNEILKVAKVEVIHGFH